MQAPGGSRTTGRFSIDKKNWGFHHSSFFPSTKLAIKYRFIECQKIRGRKIAPRILRIVHLGPPLRPDSPCTTSFQHITLAQDPHRGEKHAGAHQVVARPLSIQRPLGRYEGHERNNRILK